MNGITWGRVINERIIIFGWTIPLNINNNKITYNFEVKGKVL